MIIAAAVKIADVVCYIPAPARHHNILHSLSKSFSKRTDRGYLEETQGFITDTGEFLNREDAMKHVISCGQGTPRRHSLLCENKTTYSGPKLFSEDLW